MPTPTSPIEVSQPQLAPYYKSGDERREATQAMFDSAAKHYDYAERITSLGSGPYYRREVLTRSGLKAGMSVLDVAIGTGLVAAEAVKIIGDAQLLTGLDPSPGMLAEAKKKLNVKTIEGYAENIPLPDNQVDFLSMGYALRHVSDLNKTFSEYLRVLKPGGTACIMEIARPKSKLGYAFLKFYIRVVVPVLTRVTFCHKDIAVLWEYYWDTIQAAADPEIILQAMRDAGFHDVYCKVDMGIFREYVGTKPAAMPTA